MINLFVIVFLCIVNAKAFAISPVNQLEAVIVSPFSYENDSNIAAKSKNWVNGMRIQLQSISIGTGVLLTLNDEHFLTKIF